MMHTESEQNAIDIINAISTSNSHGLADEKTIPHETRYDTWKRSRKSKNRWTWCCCCKYRNKSRKNVDTTPLTHE